MKKFIKTFILAICLVLSATLFLTACGKKETVKVSSFTVELANTNYTLLEDTITVSYGEDYRLSFSDFSVTATFDDETSKTLTSNELEDYGFTFSSTIPNDTITPVGEYTLTLGNKNLPETDNVIIKVKVEINTIDVNALNLTWTDETTPFVYNGQEQTVEITNLPEYLEATYYHNVETIPNTYYAVASIKVKDGFTDRYNIENNEASVLNKWTIGKAELTVAVNNKTDDRALTYGDTVSYSVSDVNAIGLVGGETLESLGSISFVYSTTADGNYNSAIPKDVGTYYVKVDTLYSNNYNITYVTGELEIKKATLTVTIENKTFVYGSFGSGIVTIEGYKYDDETALEEEIKYALSTKIGKIVDGNFVVHDAKMVVGEYVCRVTGLDKLKNYTPNYTDGTLTITPKPLNITLKAKTGDDALTYGDEISYSASDISINGLVYMETLESLGNIQVVYSLSQTGTFDVTPKNAGTYYAKVAEFEQNDGNRNYTITYNVSEVEIKKAVLTVRIKDIETVYGTHCPPIEDVTGFKYGESRASAGFGIGADYDNSLYEKDNPEQLASKNQYVNVGEYIYRPPFTTMKNYTINIVYGPRGTYVIKQKEASVGIKIEKSLVYGDALNIADIKYLNNEYKNADIEWNNDLYWGEVTGTLSYTTNYTQGSPAGDYTITATGLTCPTGNYKIVYEETMFTVAPKNITIKPTTLIISYGDSINLSASNLESVLWVNDADSSILDGNIGFEYKAEGAEEFSSTVPINAGNYKYRVNIGTLSSSSYTFTSEEADYIIDRIPVKISVGNATAEYGSDFSKLNVTLTYGGVVYYDTLENRYVDEESAINRSPDGDSLRENIVAINTSLAYENDESLFTSIKEFKFGCFVNGVFEPYDSSSNNMTIGIFLAIDRSGQGWEITVDNYYIIATNGLLTLTQKEIVNDGNTANWKIDGESLNNGYDENDKCWNATIVNESEEALNVSFVSNYGDIFNVTYSYKKIASDGDIQEVESIFNEGTFEITATITLNDTIHYTLEENQKTVKLILTVSVN